MSHSNDKQRLLEKRDALRARIDAIRDDYRKGLDSDLTEQAVQLENSEVLEEILRVTIEQCDEIEQELKELDATQGTQNTK